MGIKGFLEEKKKNGMGETIPFFSLKTNVFLRLIVAVSMMNSPGKSNMFPFP